MALTQSDMDAEVDDAQNAYDRAVASGAPVRHHPPRDYAPYRSSVLRHPRQPLVPAACSAFAVAQRVLAEEDGGRV